ncbi:MAG: hypothetical protein ACK5NA_00515 [Enterococcus sp.]
MGNSKIILLTEKNSPGRFIMSTLAKKSQTFLKDTVDIQLYTIDLEDEAYKAVLADLAIEDQVYVDYFLQKDLPTIMSEINANILVDVVNMGSFSTMSAKMFYQQVRKLTKLNALEIRVHNEKIYTLMEYILPATKIPTI